MRAIGKLSERGTYAAPQKKHASMDTSNDRMIAVGNSISRIHALQYMGQTLS